MRKRKSPDSNFSSQSKTPRLSSAETLPTPQDVAYSAALMQWVPNVPAFCDGIVGKTDGVIVGFYDLPGMRAVSPPGEKIEESSEDGGSSQTNKSPGQRLLCLDLDHTLIQPISGRKFPKDINDWQFLIDREVLKKKLMPFVERGYLIIVISNQKTTPSVGPPEKHRNLLIEKGNKIWTQLKVPLAVQMCQDASRFRKPNPGCWEIVQRIVDHVCEQTREIDYSNSIFVGDAAGRASDNSAADIALALNRNVPFILPEMFFKLQGVPSTVQSFPLPANLFDPRRLFSESDRTLIADLVPPKRKEVLLLIGAPASGKSFLATQLIKLHNYERVNQDELGTKAKCIKKFESAVLNGSDVSIVIDRQNASLDQRAPYIALARKYQMPIRAVVFGVSKSYCFHAREFRKLTQPRIDIVPDVIIHSYFKNFVNPTIQEGIIENIMIDESKIRPGPFQSLDDENLFKSFLVG